MLAALLILLPALLGPGPTSSAAEGDLDGGAAAPAGRWYVQGGCAARTGVSLSTPIRSAPEVAWTLPVRGEIEEEPLVWDGNVVLCVLEESGRRRILVLNLATGDLRSSTPIVASGPLRPALWGPYLAVRPESTRIDLYRITTSRLLSVRSFTTTEGTFSAPLLFEEALYVREGEELVCWDLERREPRWRRRPSGFFRGAPSVRGRLVYGVFYDPSGRAHLAALERETGDLVESVRAAHHDGLVPPEASDLDVVVLADKAFLRFPLPVPARSGRAFQTAGVLLEPDGRPSRSVPPSVHDFATSPTAWKRGWMVLDLASQRGQAWTASTDKGPTIESVVLADSGTDAELLGSNVRASRAREVAFVDRLAFETEDFEILWKLRTPPRFPPVPADGLLLIVDARDRLTVLREQRPELGASEIAAAELSAQLEKRLADGYARLALESLRANDPELSMRLIREARLRDSGSRTLDQAEEGLERMLASDAPVSRIDRLAREVEGREADLRSDLLERLLDEARATKDDGMRRALLRAVLERDPGHEGVAVLLRDLLPPGSRPAEPLDSRSWLDFLDASARSPLRVIVPEERSAEDLGARTLLRERELWRDDLQGFESENLIILAPPELPGAVARALDLGELVCGALESLFSAIRDDPGRRIPRPGEPLVLFLYQSRDTYVEQSQRERSAPEIARGWTAGHYSPSENLSRMFVPQDDDESVRLLSVYVHELTHHWLAARSPTWARQRNDRPSDEWPHYWIVEGLATMVEEFTWRPISRAWSPDNPRAASLDIVANAHEQQLIPWHEFFHMTKQGFLELENTPNRPIDLSWKLGSLSQKSEIRMFYAQAGAVCHFLFRAQGGQFRTELLRFWSDWHGQKESFRTFVRWQSGAGKMGIEVTEFARGEVGR